MANQTQGYIMLSYQWDNQEVVKKIRDRLREEGYNVWIDIEKMEGFIFTAMSKAVEEADVVLACLSKEYEKSKNCKKECGCITEFDTPFIPLKMEDYKLTDWVAGIFSGQTYVNFSNEAKFDEKFKDLLRLLKKYPSLNPQVPNPNQLVSLLPPTPAPGATSASSTPANPDTPNTEEPYRMPELSNDIFRQLIFDVSSWWGRHGNVNMLKVLLSNFKGTIPLAEIERKDKPFGLFGLLEGPGIISRSDIDVLVEATILAGLIGVEKVFKKRVPTFPEFSKFKIHIFSKYRRTLINFGNNIREKKIEEICNFSGLKLKDDTDQWELIFELENNSKLTEETKESFIEQLKDNDMDIEAKLLE